MNPNTRNWLSAFVLLGLCCYHGRAQSASPEKPIHIPASGGEVVIATAADKARAYDEYHYAPARRAGDALYLSGVVVSRRDTDGKDVTAFKEEIRRAFRRIQATLAAAGANFDDVVMLNTFHVWQGPNFEGDRPSQFAAFNAVKDEFLKAPYPAWTAVGTTSLLPDNGIVEIQLIAHLKRK
jgi:enamine deaminase RidA (YjgF/YER057c/UK114 family)